VNLIATPLGKGESRDWRGAKQREEIAQNRGFHVAILFSDLVEACWGTSRYVDKSQLAYPSKLT
jgi:hypothetical protein